MTMGGPPVKLSAAQARRVALAAQGFTGRRTPAGPVRASHLRAVADRLGIVQLDSVNAVTRSHYLPFFSRVGPYDPALLDGLRDGGRREQRHLVEYWAHEASLIPLASWPTYGFRMRRAQDEAGGWAKDLAAEHPGLTDAVYDVIAAHGPMTARECEVALKRQEPPRSARWGWNWSWVKAACEHLFSSGHLTSAGRTAQFERRYELPERVLGPAVVDQGPLGSEPISEVGAVRSLLMLGARAHGIGSERCLRDYARLSSSQARPAIAALVADGVLLPALVAGWRTPAFLHRDARIPTRLLRARALLSPFDSLVWQRERVAALFDFDYRLEFYTPAARRVHGYYVMPFLLGDQLVGRVDVKADRAAGVLKAHSVHWEPGLPARRPDAPEELIAELKLLAEFLGLSDIAAPALSTSA